MRIKFDREKIEEGCCGSDFGVGKGKATTNVVERTEHQRREESREG